MSNDIKVMSDEQLNYLIQMIKNKYIEGVSITDKTINITKNGTTSSYELSADVTIDTELLPTSVNPVQNKVVYDAILNLESRFNKIDTKLYDTITGDGSVTVVDMKPNTYFDVSLYSYNSINLSSVKIKLTNNNEEIILSDLDEYHRIENVVSEITPFTLTLISDSLNETELSNIRITCTYEIDLNKVIRDYVLHVDVNGTANGNTNGSGSVMVDDTLSITGAAAEARTTGIAINDLKELVGTEPVYKQIADAIVDVYVQDEVPVDAHSNSLWVDTSADGLVNPDGSHIPNIYVVDAGETEMTDIDFSQYQIGDVILVTQSVIE